MKRLVAILAGIALLALLCGVTTWRIFGALTRRSDAEAAVATTASTPVEVQAATARDLVENVRVAGSLRALHEADVVGQLPGRVTAVLADVGDKVEKGQPLAQLDAVELALGVQQAEAGLAAAKAGGTSATRDLAGAVAVAEVGGVTDAQMVAAKSRSTAADAQIAQAQAGLGLARARLADATLRAPFAGVVVRRSVDLGQQLNPGMPAFAIADLSSLELVLAVDERVAASLHPGDAVGIASDTVANLPDGIVKTVSPTLDPTSHKADVVIGLAYAPGLFAHGSATATLRLGRVSGAVAVSSRAIVDDSGDHVVYVVMSPPTGSVAHRTVVNPGLHDGDWIEVKGLPVGASVVVTGNTYLSDGAAVTVRSSGPVAPVGPS